MAANWLQNLLITNNELLDPVLFFRSVGNFRCIFFIVIGGYFGGLIIGKVDSVYLPKLRRALSGRDTALGWNTD